MIDEKARRRPEFDEKHSVPIKLADGQTYWLPRPWVEIRGRFEDGKPVGLTSRTTLGPELDEGVDLMMQAETNHDLIISTLLLGACMLKVNYDLSPEELESLFVFRFDDEAMEAKSLEMVRQIADVAMGRTGAQDFRGGNG